MLTSPDFSLETFERYARLALPHGFFACLFAASFLTVPLPSLLAVKPFFILMIVYYWGIYRPTLYPPAAVFFIGLLYDFISGGVPGLHALLLVLAQWLIQEQRRFLMGQSFVMKWALFGALLAGYFLCVWLLSGLPNLQWPVLTIRHGLEVAVNWFLFPLVTLALITIHRFLPEDHEKRWR